MGDALCVSWDLGWAVVGWSEEDGAIRTGAGALRERGRKSCIEVPWMARRTEVGKCH